MPAVAALVLAVDQLSKHLVRTRLPVGQPWDAVPWLSPIFSFTQVTNTGAAFGLFRKGGDVIRVIATLVVIALILYLRHIPKDQWLMRVALGLQLGGALGNLVDRFVRGRVVDFIDLNFWPLHNWPIFNVADSSIVTGTVVLAALMLWDERLQQSSQRVAEGS